MEFTVRLWWLLTQTESPARLELADSMPCCEVPSSSSSDLQVQVWYLVLTAAFATSSLVARWLYTRVP